MAYKGIYSELNSYAEYKNGRYRSRKSRKIQKIFLGIVFLIVALGVCILALINNFFKVDEIDLNGDQMSYYIRICDSVSKDKLQINWQEVAAIDGAINNGEFALDNKDEVIKIGNEFYEYNGDSVSAIKSFDDVLNELNLSNKQKENARLYEEALKNNVLNSDLAFDEDKKKFIKEISEQAIENYKEYKILPSITVAQAILESGWGESDLSSKYNNLFGIKADDRWDGKKVKLETKENYDDVINDYFRAYKSKAQSIKDHGKFLTENERYKVNGVFDTSNYKVQAKALEKAGYSTIKDEKGNLIYADLVIGVIQNNNLMLLDTEVQRE